MSYKRVIPRDLFNEAKLLKCLGQLSLIIHDGVGVPRGLSLEHENPEEGFRIEQDDSTGAIYCSNLECFFGGRLIGLRSPLNSKEAYPLQFVLEDDEGSVFNANGMLAVEFKTLLASIGGAK
jgi:hypothetical protein